MVQVVADLLLGKVVKVALAVFISDMNTKRILLMLRENRGYKNPMVFDELVVSASNLSI